MTMRHMRGDPREGPSDAGDALGKDLLVRERMSKPAITVTTTTPVAEALELMAVRRIHYLPVVDAQGALAGMVNSDDLLGTRRRRRTQGDVGAVMSAPAVSIGPAVSLANAMRLMADRGVGALPVVEEGRILGILTQSDVVAAVARRWPA
jgi:CBS domain-containing protein